ncbi:uncharacterized protein BCR38DRAFT_422096 [Pseudomassariella vexata]|uniref:N-acetyltransferase domain-containing protein n=1 Tax=Pseudomassariella vexata TaxID=1141098 RepID=A0A1Y2EFR9_9PEZI|nr:uncharacterized protein BCR38DRAFT_422096 [Pseudomassariella vexata]ORY70421.1 hypothetical protein BCR38DRAFT_422096 [Pseudomassariella vexata]
MTQSQRDWSARWTPIDDVPDLSKEKLAAFYEPMQIAHEYLMGDRGHVFLEVLTTLNMYRGKGVGRALVQWGNDLVDEMGVE